MKITIPKFIRLLFHRIVGFFTVRNFAVGSAEMRKSAFDWYLRLREELPVLSAAIGPAEQRLREFDIPAQNVTRMDHRASAVGNKVTPPDFMHIADDLAAQSNQIETELQHILQSADRFENRVNELVAHVDLICPQETARQH